MIWVEQIDNVIIKTGTDIIKSGTDIINSSTDIINSGTDIVKSGSDIINSGTDIINRAVVVAILYLSRRCDVRMYRCADNQLSHMSPCSAVLGVSQ